MQRMRIAIGVLFGLACVCACTATVALGGQFHVYSCRTPSGAVAPTDGWTPSATGASVAAEDKCAKGGALIAGLGEGVSHPVGTDTATWTLDTPTGETLEKASLWRAGDAEGGAAANATYEFWFAGPTQPETFGSCVYVSGCMTVVGEPETPFSASNFVSVPTPNIGEHLYVNASCGGLQTYKCPSGKGDSNGYAAVVYLYAADLTLEQNTQPTVENVTGELATASALSGTADLSFAASDPGSGVYQAVFTLDGAETGRTVIDENGGHCRDLGGTGDGLPAFAYLQPCAASVNADVPFDTTALSDGTHHLVVAVTDAAGNATVVLDRKIDVLNHPQSLPGAGLGASGAVGQTTPGAGQGAPTLGPANGTPASAAASLSAHWSTGAHTALTARFGSAHAVSGRLLAPGGAPIAGAQVQAQFLPAGLGAHPLTLPAARTGANGAFTLRLPASLPSGRLTLAYSAHSGQSAPDVTVALALTVPASVSLRVSPRSSHAGGTIRFSGVLHGAPLPHGGKQLVLEARVAGPGRSHWRQFRVLTTGAHGAFKATYRFRLAGPITYQFRAVSPHEADFPYATGASNLVSVHER
ncbi:MAG: hypothetical protein ACRDK4_15450 [Solirubrobacteraceae bacterium]